MIPYSRQKISPRDINAVVRVLKSNFLTQGPAVASFEKALTRYTGAAYAVAVSNGTAALHLACLSLGVKPGDEVLTSPNSFAATANSILYCGGKPVFCDIEPDHFNLDPSKINRLITKRTVGILPVHFAGHPCKIEPISSIARKRGLFVLEDACHALGAEYTLNGTTFRVGSCSHSDAAIFSFHPVKSIATGEGGAILTNRRDLYEKLILLRTHGITKDPALLERSHEGSWYYEMQALGFNYRMSDLQAALGESQMKQLPGFIKKRREIVKIYRKAFSGMETFSLPPEDSDVRSACHLFVIRLNLDRLNTGRKEIFENLRKIGVGVQVHYIPIHFQPYYRKNGFQSTLLPICENYYKRAISLPVFPSMTQKQVREVIKKVSGLMRSFAIA